MQPNDTFKKLNFFDVTNLLVGIVVGADIYVVASLGSQYLGPASLVAWIVAGVIAIIIALNFAECATLVPKVGGPYAYAQEVWGDFAGFVVGWSLWLAEVATLAVFPVAFVRYLTFFLPSLTSVEGAVVKLLFIAAITYVNIRGTKTAGRANDILTIAKLSPLVLLIIAGLIYMGFNPAQTAANFVPFAPLGFSHFGQALVLIFWAYAGFELAVIPSNEVENPTRTIPKAIIVGMAIVTLFYLLTNFVIIGVVNWTSLQFDTAPLATAGSVVFSITPTLALIGSLILGLGALISVSGSDESGTLSTSRLSYAISLDGLFPRFFSDLHHKYGSPHKNLIAQASLALGLSLFGGLGQLILFSTFNLAFVYLITCSVVLALRERGRIKIGRTFIEKMTGPIIPIGGILLSALLIYESGISTVVFGLITIAFGIPIYAFYSPRSEREMVKATFYSTEAVLSRVAQTQRVFLGYLLRIVTRRKTTLSNVRSPTGKP
jgi:basic amino acid/polyamine antiporter, APA family